MLRIANVLLDGGSNIYICKISLVSEVRGRGGSTGDFFAPPRRSSASKGPAWRKTKSGAERSHSQILATQREVRLPRSAEPTEPEGQGVAHCHLHLTIDTPRSLFGDGEARAWQRRDGAVQLMQCEA